MNRSPIAVVLESVWMEPSEHLEKWCKRTITRGINIEGRYLEAYPHGLHVFNAKQCVGAIRL